ncbi:unnamed protein product, partial [Rotaria sp. Silwood2]
PINSTTSITVDIKWIQNGTTIVEEQEFGETLDKFGKLEGFYVDYDDQMIYICDSWFKRVVKWKYYSKIGELTVGDNGNGNQSDQLNHPIDLIIDKDNDSLIICDRDERQVVRWPRQNGTNKQIIILNIDCNDSTMDHDGDLYFSEFDKNQEHDER